MSKRGDPVGNGEDPSALNGPSEHRSRNKITPSMIPETTSPTVRLRKELGLTESVGIIVGIIVGAGIFVSPKGVLLNAGSVGLSLIVWLLSGLLSLIGALCYAELGTMIPTSGGAYAYINEAFGALPAFLYLWVALWIIIPTGNAVLALTFAQYSLQVAWPTCQPPYEAMRLLAVCVTLLLTALNCTNVKWVTRIQDVFVGAKVLALGIVVVTGMLFLGGGHTRNLERPFQGSTSDPGLIALAFYSGLFSFVGWNYLNFVTEEIKDPHKNLPRAIWISLPVVTGVYVLVNLAYLVMLTRDELLTSHAVAVTFSNKILTSVTWMMPLVVACSTFGALNGTIFASSRLFFVGARRGHLPAALALINVDHMTPIPSLVFLCFITLMLVTAMDVYKLINYFMFAESFFTTLSIAGLLCLRYKRPDALRPVKVHLVFPVLFLVVCVFLVFLPLYQNPGEVAMCIAIIATGVPVFLVCVRWQNPPPWLLRAADSLTLLCAKLFKCVLED